MTRTTHARIAGAILISALALAGCGDSEEPEPAPTSVEQAPSDGGSTAPSASNPTDGGDEEAAVCEADDSDQEVPTEAPRADAWPDYYGTGVPVSDTYGPTQRDGDLWTCYSHSPTGALFAAAYLRPAIAYSSVREAYVSDDPQTSEGDFDAPRMKLRGYSFTGYEEDKVSLELVYEGASGGESGLVVFPMTLYWEGEQWVLHSADVSSAETRTITGLTGYTPWSVGA